MRSLPALSLLLLTACSYPSFVASKTVEYEVPADGVQRLACTTHNGAITVTGDAAAKPIRLRAEITARATSQAEADALLHQLDVRRDLVDGALQVGGQGPQTGWTTQSSFAFTFAVPPSVRVALESHNGALRVTGMQDEVSAVTHNGEVVVDAAAPVVATSSHNGDVRLTLRGELREATVETHNGEVAVEMAAAGNAKVTVETHNGTIHVPANLRDAVHERGLLQGRFGEGKGNLRITTHNGDVRLR